VGDYAEVYWHRRQALALDPGALPWDAFALRFAAWAPGVSSGIVGTTSAAHLRHNADQVQEGPLPEAVRAAVAARFAAVGAGWRGEV